MSNIKHKNDYFLDLKIGSIYQYSEAFEWWMHDFEPADIFYAIKEHKFGLLISVTKTTYGKFLATNENWNYKSIEKIPWVQNNKLESGWALAMLIDKKVYRQFVKHISAFKLYVSELE